MPRLPSQLLTLLLLAALAGPAAAAGVNLSWDACTGDGGVQNKTFACNTNAGGNPLFASFALASDMANVIGIEAKVDITAQADSLPAWWRFQGPNACRGGLSAAFGFDSENSNCTDTFRSMATGAVAAVHTYWTTPQVPGGNPATAQALLIAAVPASMAQNLTRIQNGDGSWTGHHCITGRTFCTAAALLVLTADRAPFPVASKVTRG